MTSKSPVCFLLVWGSVFTAVCEPVCVRGEGHDKGLHLVIIAGCVISATCLRTGLENGVHVFVCAVRGWVVTERSANNKFAVRNSQLIRSTAESRGLKALWRV